MRLSPNTGKANCRIIDFVDSSNRVSGVVSTPTLFGLEPSEITIEGELFDHRVRVCLTEVADESLDDMERRADEVYSSSADTTNDIPLPTAVTYVDYNDPFSFLCASKSATSPYIAMLSRNGWVAIGEHKYILECLGKGHIRVERVAKEGMSSIWICRSMLRAITYRRRTLLCCDIHARIYG